jgi:CheY-like chemotaxis protein
VILVVTADWFREKLLVESLQGWETQLCRDAYSALDYAAQAELIFLDADLPAANGVAFVHELASDADSAKIPVILLADYMPNVDFGTYNIEQVLSTRELVPEKIRRIVGSLMGTDGLASGEVDEPPGASECKK